MRKAYTSRITKPPRLVTVENLSSFLTFYGIDNSLDLVDSLKTLLDSSSLYSLIEVILQVTIQSEVTIALLAIEKVVRNSTFSRQGFLQTTYTVLETSLLDILEIVKDQATLTDFLTNYLGLESFSIAEFYSNPYSLIDWVGEQDVLYTSTLNYLKQLDLFNFFIELIKIKSFINLSEHLRSVNLLEVNLKSELYKNVLGAFPLQY
jgi:hypothetical protein